MSKILIGIKTIVINSEGKILLLRRSETAKRPLGWDLVGGGVAKGEEPTESAIREIREEAGLEVSDIKPIDVILLQEDANPVVMIAFQAKAGSNEVKLSLEHDQFKWVTKDELLALDIPETFKRFTEQLRI